MLKKIICFALLWTSPAFAEDKIFACDIRLDFKTSTTGIDSKTYAGIMDRIVATPAITEKHAENLDMSGARTLCLTVRPEELGTVYEELKALIPEENKFFVTSIQSRDGHSFATHTPVKFQRNAYSK